MCLCFCHNYVHSSLQKRKCAWGRYLINHKTGVHITFGFLLFTNSVNINWNVNATKYQNPQGFLISLQSWWYKATSFCANFYSKIVLSKHLTNKLDNFPVSFVHQPTLPSQILDQPLQFLDKISVHHSRCYFTSTDQCSTNYLFFRTSKCLVSSILFGRSMGCTLSGFWHNVFHCSSCKPRSYNQLLHIGEVQLVTQNHSVKPLNFFVLENVRRVVSYILNSWPSRTCPLSTQPYPKVVSFGELNDVVKKSHQDPVRIWTWVLWIPVRWPCSLATEAVPLQLMIDSIYPWTLFDSKAGSLLGLVFTNIFQHLSLRLGVITLYGFLQMEKCFQSTPINRGSYRVAAATAQFTGGSQNYFGTSHAKPKKIQHEN